MRKFVSALTITLGPIQMIGSLYPLVKTEKATGPKFRKVIPDTETPVLARQVYVAENEIDADNPRLYTQDALGLALETADGLAFVDRDDVADARRSELPLNLVNVTVHRADALTWNPQPTGTLYAFVPNTASEHYAALVDALSDGDYTFLSVANVRNVEGLFRLIVLDRVIVMQKVHWPEDLNDVDVPDIESSPELSEAVSSMIRAMASAPSDEMFVSGVRRRVAEIETGEVHVTQAPEVETRASLLDLVAQFAQSVDE